MPKKSIFRQPGAQHFQLVHRSQRDPLIHDPDAPQHVLKAFERENVLRKGKTREDLEASLSPDVIQASTSRANIGQASLYDIYYDDTEYDYMQHLRPVTGGQGESDDVEVIMLPAPDKTQSKSKGKGKARGWDADSFLKDPQPSTSTAAVPKEALPSAIELERDYEAGAAVHSSIAGFQPDMDRHLRQTLEALDDEAFVDNQLEDDFFGELVKDGEREEDEDVDFEYDDAADEYDEEQDAGYSAPGGSSMRPPEGPDDDWMSRFAQFKREQASKPAPSDGGEEVDDVGSEGRDTITGLPRLPVVGGKRRRKGASDASGYSLTSSSMFRNEGLSTLDERFAKIEEEYASDGDDDYDEDGATLSQTSGDELDDDAPSLLPPREDFDSLLDDFLEKYEVFGGKLKTVLPGSTGAEKLETIRRAIGGDDELTNVTGATAPPDSAAAKKLRVKAILEEAQRQAQKEADGEEDEDIPMPSIVGIGKDEGRWDVETILSTYSNLENHPRLISARDASKPKRTASIPQAAKQIRIELDPRTGLPRVASITEQADPLEDEDGDNGERRKAAVGRNKSETAEEKRARKHAVKEQRQVSSGQPLPILIDI
ncbi:LTV-domain-containing protein, partial [Clavulina sp. PMI_390]